VLRLTRKVLSGERLTKFRLKQELEDVSGLVRGVDEYLTRLFRAPMPPRVAEAIPAIARAARVYGDLAGRLSEFQVETAASGPALDGRLDVRIRQAQFSLLHLLQSSRPFTPELDAESCRGELVAVEEHLRELRSRLLEARAEGGGDPAAYERAMERLGMMQGLGRLAVDAAEDLAAIHDAKRGGGETSFALEAAHARSVPGPA